MEGRPSVPIASALPFPPEKTQIEGDDVLGFMGFNALK
jgi:hypothetical protein